MLRVPCSVLLVALWLAACLPMATPAIPLSRVPTANLPSTIENQQLSVPTRPVYNPGELVDYIAQTGDTLPALAAHFNTSEAEIRAANLILPADATTLPPGLPMKIPIYYAPFWGSSYQILPDSLFINGPAQVGFDAQTFVAGKLGWLNGALEYAAGANRSGAQVVQWVTQNFSVSPQVLLALLEYTSGALSRPVRPNEAKDYPLGYEDWQHKGLYLQLVWAANTLNNGYYGWRTGQLTSFNLLDGRQERLDPWQNAASAALHYYFSRLLPSEAYAAAIAPDGFAATYRELFGDPWQAAQTTAQPHIPGSLRQPAFTLPFLPGLPWAYTGGPHAGWGNGDPLAALDFAPGAIQGGCTPTKEWATAVAPGVVVRTDVGVVILDLDSDAGPADGDERTGWVVFYLHIETEGRVAVGTRLKTGDPVGHPSCEGGESTGTHVHIARKYNGEWVPAAGPLAFNLEGWVAQNGAGPYQGTLTRYSNTIRACECSDQASQIEAGK